MKKTAVILISIDDNEQSNLRKVLDDIFGEFNFVGTIIWRGGKRNAAKVISTSHEYMLAYAKDLKTCIDLKVEWRENKKGLSDIYKYANQFIEEVNGNFQIASEMLKKWFATLSEDNESKFHKHYHWIDERGVYFASDISRGGGGGPTWELINPETGNAVKTPSRGWAYSSYNDLLSDVEVGLIHFNGDGVPCSKTYLMEKEVSLGVVRTVGGSSFDSDLADSKSSSICIISSYVVGRIHS
jgi:adenine-specific DNA-methyltransferase